MTILCDLCLEPTDEPALLACVEADHCAGCQRDCRACQQAAADEYRTGVAEYIRLNGVV